MSSPIIYTYRRRNRETQTLMPSVDAALTAARKHAESGVTPISVAHVTDVVLLAGDELPKALAGVRTGVLDVT